MKLFDDLKIACNELAQWPGCWALCGGVAAAIYRDIPRFTADIDFVIADHPDKPAKDIAEQVTRTLSLKPIAGFITDEGGRLISGQALVMGRRDTTSRYVGIDFLLPVLPWIPGAVLRAQSNLLDFGFAKLPTITVEDLLVAKLYAFQGTPSRVTDLDDIRSILQAQTGIDMSYIRSQMTLLSLHSIPEIDAFPK